MIKARGITAGGGSILVLGLSFDNLARLKAGSPIRFDGKPYGYEGEIMILAGPTEEAMARLLLTGENPGVETILEKDAP